MPVFLSSGVVDVPVEMQIRTVAMDFWASLEHKIFYKYSGDVPPHIARSLQEAATTAARLDEEMESLHRDVHGALPPVPVEMANGSIPIPDAVLARFAAQRVAFAPLI